MRFYIKITNPKTGDYMEAHVDADSPEEARDRMFREDAVRDELRTWGVKEVDFEVTQSPDLPDVLDDGTFILQPSKDAGYWVLTDTVSLLVLKFKEGDYNHFQQVTPIDDQLLERIGRQGPAAIATRLRLMADYMRKFHPELL